MECGCLDGGPHTAHCLAETAPAGRVLDGSREIAGRDGACVHHWVEVRTEGWMHLTVCKCHARRRFMPADFNAAMVAGTASRLPVRV